MEWINIKDNKPKLKSIDGSWEISETIFVLAKSGSRYIGRLDKNIFKGRTYFSFTGTEIDLYGMNLVEVCINPAEITHWMPLPEELKED